MATSGFTAVITGGAPATNGFSILLRAHQHARGMSPQEFASLLGIEPEQYRRIAAGATIPPMGQRRTVARALGYADVLDLDESWRDGRFALASADPARVPVINKVPGGPPRDYAEWSSVDSGGAPEFVDRPTGFDGEFLFALVVVGRSMSPLFEEGDLVFFRPLAAGDCVDDEQPLMVRTADGDCTFKLGQIEEGATLLLRPANHQEAASPRAVPVENIVRVGLAVHRVPSWCEVPAATGDEPRVVRDEWSQDVPELE